MNLLIQFVTSSLINALSRKGVVRGGKVQKGRFLRLLALPLMIKSLGKGVTRAAKVDNKINHMDKNF